MKIVQLGINDISPYENNPRHNDDAVDAVANSIKEFGFKVPIVIDKDNIIVTGHTRWKAAKRIGLEEVPCIIADDLTEDQIKAFRLVDNKVGELATWDFNALNLELNEIRLDIEPFGFEVEPLDIGYGDDFTLPDEDKPGIEQMTFTLSSDQAELIRYALTMVDMEGVETFDNTNKNGNALYGVIYQWVAQKK